MNARPGPDLVGRLRHEVSVEAEELTRHGCREDQHPAQHDRSQGMEPELEGSDDAEVATASTQAPEQVGVLRLGRDHHAPIGCDHLGPDQVVAHEPECPLEPTAPAAESEPGDTGGRHAATSHGQAVLLRRGVDLAPGGTAFDPDDASGGIDRHGTHPSKIEAHPCVHHRGAGHAMPAAVDRERKVVVACQSHDSDDVVDGRAPGDDRRLAVDHGVEDGPRLLERLFSRMQQRPREPIQRQLSRAHLYHRPSPFCGVARHRTAEL